MTYIGRNRQLPTVVAIHERQVNERALIDRPLFIGNAVSKAELPRHFIPGIGEQREAQLVLIAHEE